MLDQVTSRPLFVGLSLVIIAISCQRRIINGFPAENVRYMAYLVKSNISTKTYASWLCGGCIVHPRFILTSATCVVDVDFVYAIAGYKKYVKAEDIDKDECTKRVKKRVVSYCHDRDYSMKIDLDDWWNWENIALAKVETPYDFHSEIYLQYCSYQPILIEVNYNKQFELPGTDVITLGWGSAQYYRPEGSKIDLNEEYLLYGSSVIITKEECRPPYEPTGQRFVKHINRHWICIMKLYGRLDVDGNIVRTQLSPSSSLTSCEDRHLIERTIDGKKVCVDEYGFRRFDYSNVTETNETLYSYGQTRRAGICQNDHGGPLVTWIGGRPYVIGVATAFLVDKYMRCRGPYVFCSTHCNSRLVYCTLKAQRRRSSYCGVNGSDFVEKEVKWNDD